MCRMMHQSQKITENIAEKMVLTGGLAIGSKRGLIRSIPLGSCIAFIAYDKTTKTGNLAHIMLPGKSPKVNKEDENKYAKNAIVNLLFEISEQGAVITNIEFCFVGGANVLRKENDTVADDLINSVF